MGSSQARVKPGVEESASKMPEQKLKVLSSFETRRRRIQLEWSFDRVLPRR
jgi:hypothetical protein